MSSTEAPRKRANRSAASSTGSRARRCGFWVAMPTGQLSVWHARMPRHPMACIAELAMATASAPRARAVAMSAASRMPPVATSVTSLRPMRSRWTRARASAGIVGIEMLSRKISGAAAPTVEDDVVDADGQRRVEIALDVLGRQLEADGDTRRPLANLVRELPEVVDRAPIGEPRRRNGRCPLRQPADLGDPPHHLRAGQVTTGAGLGPLAALEVESL